MAIIAIAVITFLKIDLFIYFSFAELSQYQS